MTKVSPVRRWPDWSRAAGSASGALVVVEESAEAEIGAPTALRIVDERVYGETKVVFLAYGDEGFRPSV